MEQVFGYFDYVECEIYDGFLRIRYDKPRVQGLHKIVVIDRVVWVYKKDASGQYVPDVCGVNFAIYQVQED